MVTGKSFVIDNHMYTKEPVILYNLFVKHSFYKSHYLADYWDYCGLDLWYKQNVLIHTILVSESVTIYRLWPTCFIPPLLFYGNLYWKSLSMKITVPVSLRLFANSTRSLQSQSPPSIYFSCTLFPMFFKMQNTERTLVLPNI